MLLRIMFTSANYAQSPPFKHQQAVLPICYSAVEVLTHAHSMDGSMQETDAPVTTLRMQVLLASCTMH
jgi:hypothetical protein